MPRGAFLALILAGLLWGLGFPLGKVALREIDAGNMVLLRFAFAALAAAPFALRRPEARALFRSPVVLACGALYGVAFLIQFEGLASIDVSLAALLVGTMPALIAVASRLLGEPVSRFSWAGVTAATLGAAVIAGRPGGGGSPVGITLSLISLLVFLAWLMVLRRAPKAPTAMAIPAITVIVATATLVPLALLLHGPPPLALSPAAWGAIAAQGLFCTLISTAAWQWAAPQVGAATAGVFVNIEPVMGSIIGVLAFGDRPTLGLVLGGLMIVVGSVVVAVGHARDARAEPAPTPA